MNPRKVKAELAKAREQQRTLRKQIDELRVTLIDAGINPDPPKVNLIPRNKKIYKSWKDGRTFIEVGNEFNLSAGRVSSICRRIEIALERREGSFFKKYRDLLKYK